MCHSIFLFNEIHFLINEKHINLSNNKKNCIEKDILIFKQLNRVILTFLKKTTYHRKKKKVSVMRSLMYFFSTHFY